MERGPLTFQAFIYCAGAKLFFQKHSQLELPCSPGLGLQEKAVKLLEESCQHRPGTPEGAAAILFLLWRPEMKVQHQREGKPDLVPQKTRHLCAPSASGHQDFPPSHEEKP